MILRSSWLENIVVTDKMTVTFGLNFNLPMTVHNLTVLVNSQGF